jgi:hypothetical protein
LAEKEKGRCSALFEIKSLRSLENGTCSAADLRQLGQAEFDDFFFHFLYDLVHDFLRARLYSI